MQQREQVLERIVMAFGLGQAVENIAELDKTWSDGLMQTRFCLPFTDLLW